MFTRGKQQTLALSSGQISKTNRIIDRGIGIRVAANKAVGFAYTNVIDDQKAVEKAIPEL